MESLPCEKRVKQHKGIENESIEVDDEGFVVVVRREDGVMDMKMISVSWKRK